MRQPLFSRPFVALAARLWPLGAGGGLILLFFWKLAFTNLILARGDTFLYFYPYWQYRAQALLAGRLPLWNPDLFMGAPFLANSQAGVLYPLNWPLVFFPAPVAVKLSILLHLLIAAVGAYLFARRALGQSRLGALLAALLLALGGYLTSQVEHVNQLQGLAWFPWLLLVTHSYLSLPRAGRFECVRAGCLRLGAGAGLLALQLLAGHTQSAFISLAGVGVYGLFASYAAIAGGQGRAAGWVAPLWAKGGHGMESDSQPNGKPAVRAGLPVRRESRWPRRLLLILAQPLGFLAMAGVVAVCLSAAQLWPTLELSQQSLRGGGLPWREAVSFSLNPRLLGRALLPGYTHGVFSEFVAYLGVAGLVLAGLGVGKSPRRLAMLALAGVGLAFALGAYDPLYAALAYLPPFNLFRVPARWLFLLAFGGAMLAGYGLDRLRDWELPAGWRLRLAALWPLAVVAGLVLLTPLANQLVPPGETGPLGAPGWRDWFGWLAPLALLAASLWLKLPARVRVGGAVTLALGELFIAGQILPYNHPTTPEAYGSVRPAMTQLLADRGAQPPDRFLSMSALRFDPGDLAELHSELDRQLPADAVYDAIIATKEKEVLSPNLPLAWNIPAVDGYDGGILPLKSYAAFTQLFTGAPSADGRLRENLTTVPDNRLLSLVNARYLTTDKVSDAWVDNVFYDLQFTLTLKAGESWLVAYVPAFETTALGVVMDTYSGSVRLTFADGASAELPITAGRVRLAQPATPKTITLVGPLTLHGLSLIDERVNAFQSLTLGPYRLVHSGDVKIYQNLNVLPRAFVAQRSEMAPDEAAVRARLADPQFDSARAVVLIDGPAKSVSAAGMVTITAYSPERVRLSARGPGWLVLTDAYYPGWQATVDGQPAPLYRADIMFRAVWLPEGTHSVEFRYAPDSVCRGLWASGVAWVLWLATLLVCAVVRPRRKTPAAVRLA